MEKLCDILNTYKSVYNKLNLQNFLIKNFIKNFSEKIRFISKKQLIIKIQIQKKEMQEILKEKISNNYYQNEISNINHKYSIVNTISNGVLNECDINLKNKNNNYFKQIFMNVINSNINNLVFLKPNQDLVNKLKLLNINIDIQRGETGDNEESEGPDNKVDIEILKNKINKLKQKYLDENGIKSNPYDDKKSKGNKNKK